MTWVKLDESFDEHPKVDALSDAAFRLHVAAICYCNRSLTDGHIPANRALRLTATASEAALVELVSSGLWEDAAGGWQIHDYLTFQPSKAKVLAEREAAAERARRYREARSSRRDARRDVTRDARRESRDSDPTRPEGSRVGESVATQPRTEPVDNEPVPERDLDLARSQVHDIADRLRERKAASA